MPLISEEKPTKAVEIVISDTGPGLDEGQVKRIFERFYQVENLNKTYYGGTGIGLEVVQSFVHLHKGKIKVDSKPNEGTTFKIILPKGKSHFSSEEISHKKANALVKKGQIVPESYDNYNHENQEVNTEKGNNTCLLYTSPSPRD